MRHLSYVGFLLTVGSLLLVPVSAQNSARVQHVVVRGSGDAMEVEIQTSGAPVAPNTQAITGPDRILVDFLGALPASELRALTVNRGALKSVRSGLFSSNPAITRIVLDLAGPQSYQISTAQNAVVIKLNNVKLNNVELNNAKLNPATPNPTRPDTAKLDPAKLNSPKLGTTKLSSAKLDPAAAARARTSDARPAAAARFQNTALVARTVAAPRVPVAVSDAVSVAAPSTPAAVSGVLQPMPFVSVAFVNGMLSIHADKATLAQVLFEVQRQTKAEIAIPAGAEREQVIADLGPGPAREVLGSLLNGMPYNIIFVGNELGLERVILTLRDP
jgi:hypothetical protein